MINSKLPPSLQNLPTDMQDKLLKALPNNFTLFDMVTIGYPLLSAKKEESFTAKNANISPDEQRQIDLATAQFKQSVERVDNQILNQYIQAIQNGDYSQAEAILENAEQSQQTNTLMFALLTIGVILLPLYARQRIQNLLIQFGLHTVFAQTDSGQRALRQQAEKGATSHVRTIAKDIKKSLDDAIDSELTNPAIEAAVKDKYEELIDKESKAYVAAVHKDQNIYKYARDLILAGESRQSVIKKLQENFSEVGKRRANVIAGNEANRVFTMSQFDADQQFLAQNKLTNKAYKRLVSNTGTPEAICKAIIERTRQHPIPFNQDFAKFGVQMIVQGDNGKTYKFTPNYEHLKSGHIHVNCHCRYELLIQKEDGTFMNTYTWKIENDINVDFTPDLHPRDKDGKFAKKGTDITDGTSKLDLGILNTKSKFDKYVKDSTLDYGAPEARAAALYQSPHFYKLNEAVRWGDSTASLNGKTVNVDKFKNTLDPTFDIEADKETTLYRGVGDPASAFKVNQEYKNNGYTSTSTVEATAREKFMGPGGAMIHLTVPKGTKVSIPDLVSRDISTKNMDEQEAILQRGSSYIVYKIEGDIVYATLV